ncbi:MAG: pilus assembly protein PilM [Phycisphaeraceae bacterium]|nr:pilus assembly protein PilM [Phycisphaeraceae bacterium]
MLRLWPQSGVFPIGVDFGAGGVRLLQLGRNRGGYRLIAAATAELDSSAAQLNEDARFRTLLDTVRRRVESAGFSGRRCVISVEDTLLRVKSIRQPIMPASDAEKAIRLEAGDRLGFGEDTPSEIGWIRAGEVRQGDDVREELILVGAEQRRLEQIVDGVAAIGLQPIAVEPGFLATARCFARDLRRASDTEIIRFVIDVGYLTTTVTILRGLDVVFYKRFEIGGRSMDAAAAERLRLDKATIADLRRQRIEQNELGVKPKDERVHRAIYTAIRPSLEELAHEVSLCLRYHSVSFCGQRPDKVVVVGGDAAEPGLVEALYETLRVPVEIGRPLEGVELSRATGVIEPHRALSAWTVATGLCLRSDASLAPSADRAEQTARFLARKRATDRPAKPARKGAA